MNFNKPKILRTLPALGLTLFSPAADGIFRSYARRLFLFLSLDVTIFSNLILPHSHIYQHTCWPHQTVFLSVSSQAKSLMLFQILHNREKWTFRCMTVPLNKTMAYCMQKGLQEVITTTNPVKTQQFIILFSPTCFGLKVHHQVEDKNKRT